jgi:hypothetical protein
VNLMTGWFVRFWPWRRSGTQGWSSVLMPSSKAKKASGSMLSHGHRKSWDENSVCLCASRQLVEHQHVSGAAINAIPRVKVRHLGTDSDEIAECFLALIIHSKDTNGPCKFLMMDQVPRSRRRSESPLNFDGASSVAGPGCRTPSPQIPPEPGSWSRPCRLPSLAQVVCH